MKKILLALTVICFMASPVFASEAEVEKAVEGFRLAMLSGKKADLENIPMKSLVYVHSAGAVDDYEIFLDKVVDGKVDTYKKMEFKDQKINVDGDVALVRHVFEGTIITAGRDNGQPYDVKLNVVQIWRKDGDVWKLFARQSYIPPTPK